MFLIKLHPHAHALSFSACPRPWRVCHAHPDVPASESLMKNRSLPHSSVFNLPNPQKRCLQQAEHSVIPLRTRRLPPVHNPTPTAADLQRGRGFSSHSFSSDWPDSSLRSRWHPLILFNLINQRSVSGLETVNVILLIAACLRSDLWFQRAKLGLQIIIIIKSGVWILNRLDCQSKTEIHRTYNELKSNEQSCVGFMNMTVSCCRLSTPPVTADGKQENVYSLNLYRPASVSFYIHICFQCRALELQDGFNLAPSKEEKNVLPTESLSDPCVLSWRSSSQRC